MIALPFIIHPLIRIIKQGKIIYEDRADFFAEPPVINLDSKTAKGYGKDGKDYIIFNFNSIDVFSVWNGSLFNPDDRILEYHVQ